MSRRANREASPFLQLSKAMVLGLARDRAAVFFMLVFPLMFLVLFGALFKNDATPHAKVVQVGQVAVLDKMPAETKKQIEKSLTITKSSDREDALRQVRGGDQDAMITQRDGEVRLQYSAADQARAGNVRGVINAMVQQANVAATGKPPAYTLKTATVEDDSLQAIQFLAPGLLGWAIAMGGAFSAAFVLVNWRKKRILRRLWLAPIGAGTVIGARIGVSLALAFAQTAIFLGVATLPYYGLQLTGMWWLSIPLVVCGTLAFMSVGLLVGSWAKTEEAANGLMQIIILPMAFLSGSFFPLDATPDWVQSISQVLPLKHLNTAMQQVLSRGGGWGDVLPTMGGLLLFTVVLTALAARLFKWDDA
ncbi:ABC transporter permease [Streptomyces sp. NPDC005438]|uniref:ABC transporter permease n=1 Tax=Streptomyces sp. NPDC005438 TaxID=3156880 RepID=UPI0033AC680C